MNVLEVVMCPHAMCCPYLMECRLSLLYLFLSLTTPAPSTCKSVLSIYLMDYYLTFKIDEEYSVFLSSFVPKTPTLVLVLCYVSYYSKHIHIKKKSHSFVWVHAFLPLDQNSWEQVLCIVVVAIPWTSYIQITQKSLIYTHINIGIIYFQHFKHDFEKTCTTLIHKLENKA